MDSDHVAALATLRKCWSRVLDGRATEEDLLDSLQDFELKIQARLDELEAQREPANAGLIRGYERQLAAVDRMAQELEEPDQGHMERGLEMAQRAQQELLQVQQGPPSSTIDCPFCAQPVARGSARCLGCGRNLPVLLEGEGSGFSLLQNEGLSSGAGGRRLTQNAAQLVRSVESWRAGEIGWEALYQALDEIEDKLLQHQEANAAKHAAGDPRGFYHRTHELLEESLAALDHMRLAWDTQEESYLEAGLGQFCTIGEALLQVGDEQKQAT